MNSSDQSNPNKPGDAEQPPAAPTTTPGQPAPPAATDAPGQVIPAGSTVYRGLTLDAFQLRAIAAIESGRSVVLAAPTGSGKTLVAEYLIDKFLRTNRRIIYTSPIKALSNQKFRDFSGLYPDKVGILTGDVVINREAPVLIMTTEVYRNMAIEDPDVIRDVAYVIFDEVHYLGDLERGTVWEESIIFAPKGTKFLALSATIPNADELAAWIGAVSEQKIEVISHEVRAVPLKFQYYFQNSLWFYKDLAKRLARPSSEGGDDPRRRRRTRGDEGQRYIEVVQQLAGRQQLPVLYFAFSRMLVDKMAGEAAKRFDFTNAAEKREINTLCRETLEKYNLSEFESAVSLTQELERGVGRHHAGLLPQLKELVEVLFSRRLLQALFVTETFAVGVNMPARSVAFDALKKFDGRSFRPMKTLEFYQLAGRAGRRGIDPVGYVVIPHLPRDLEWDELDAIVNGNVEKLNSAFDLSFNSVLNLYTQHPHDEVRTILKRNFAQFQANKHIPELARKVERLRIDYEAALPECHMPEHDLDAFMAFQEKKRQILDTMRAQLGQTKKGMRGRKQRGIMHKIKGDANIKAAALREEEDRFLCGQCKQKGKCLHLAFRALKVKRKLDQSATMLEQVEEMQLPIYEEKIKQMKTMGYLDENGILPRGQFAAKIHTEEIAVAELYFQGYFHEWDEHEINALLMAVVYEARKNTVIVPPPKGQALDRLRDARNFLRSLSIRHPFIKPLDIRLSLVMWSWSKGAQFDDLLPMTDLPEGDLIRQFRQAIDLCRQIREATDDAMLRSKLARCLALINRDIVLATELRD